MKTRYLVQSFFSSLVIPCWIAIALCVGAYGFLTTTEGAKIIVTCFAQAYMPFTNIKIGEYSGTIEKGLTLKNVTISNIPDFKGAVIQAQDIYFQLPIVFWKTLFVKITHAKLDVSSESIIFEGTITDNKIRGNCFANTIDTKEFVSALGYDMLAKDIYGFFSRIDLDVDGTLQEPHFTGHFLVDKFAYKNTQVIDGFSHLDLTIMSLGKLPQMKGSLTMESALVKVDRINIDLTKSVAELKGDVSNPSLDIHGTTSVDDINIDMAIKGTLSKPILLFSSDPPMSEREILTALITKGWSGTPNMQGHDFGLRKSLTDSFNVGMRFDQKDEQVGQTRRLGYSKSIEGQLNVTDKFSFNVAQKYLPTSRDQAISENTHTQQQKDNETEFTLQYKLRF